MVCLECWRSLDSDPLHLDCTGDHFVPCAEADEIHGWLSGRYWFMVRTSMVAASGDLESIG